MVVTIRAVVVWFILWGGISCKVFLGCYDLVMNPRQLLALDAFVGPVCNGVIPGVIISILSPL